MQVWFVSRGTYSDYEWLRVFSSEALAEQYAAGDDDRFIEGQDFPIEVVDSLPKPVTTVRLYCTLDRDGVQRRPGYAGEKEERKLWFEGVDEERERPPECYERMQANPSWQGSSGFSYPATIYLSVEGSDVERVRKVYSERKAQCLAEFDIIIAKEEARRAR